MNAIPAQTPTAQGDDPLSAQGSPVNHSKLGHIPSLDGVRGVAILLVLINHFSPEGAYDNRIAMLAQPITRHMTIGVDLFFVLSGFLITGILLRSKTSNRFFRNFYTRRALRIFPLYYLVLTLLAIGLHTIPSWRNLTALRQNWPWYWFYGTNYLVCLRGFSALGQSPVSLGHFWSLAVEEHFYLFWPMLVWLCSSRGLTRACLAIIVIAPLCRAWAIFNHESSVVLFVATQCRMDCLALGALMAVSIQRNTVTDLLRRFGWISLLSAFASIACFALNDRHVQLGGASIRLGRLLDIVSYSFVAFAWAGFILLALNSASLVARFMSHRWLRFFGVYSYGMYVYHRLILSSLTTWFSIRHLSFHGKLWTGILAHYSLCIGATVLIAFASYHLYEKHFLKLKRLFE